MKTIFLILGTALFLLGCGGDESQASAYDKPYSADATQNLKNPNRGFYRTVSSLDKLQNYNRFQIVKDEGFELVYAPLKLYNYIETQTLSDKLLETLEKNLQEAQAANIKIITRIQYRDNNATDPKKDIILSHLEQLAPIFQKYEDVISTVEAGCIGAYGEWHSFGEDFVDTNPDYKQNRQDIVYGVEKVFPNKFILLRTPMHKELLFGASVEYKDVADEAKITPSIAYSDDIRAKVSHHNDCFLASQTDNGTYPSSNIEFWKDYVANDALYAPLGGETCADDVTYSNCANAQNELQKMGWSFLNNDYYPEVLERWKREGCYNTISQNLGYHFVAKGINYTQNDDSLHIDLFVFNKGYSQAFTNYDVRFLLFNDNIIYTFEHNEIDVRKWFASEEEKLSIDIDFNGIAEGNYTLGMQIGSLPYTVRFANKNMWNDALKANVLLENIEVK